MAPVTTPQRRFTATNANPGVTVKRGLRAAAVILILLGGLLLAGCSITIGPQPTPGTVQPGQPTFTPIEQIRVDITHVPTPTVGPPTATAGPVGEAQKYTVKSGDTLSGIAEQFGVTVEDIVKFNNITDPNAIFEGEEILIPPPGGGQQPAGPTPAGAPPVASSTPAATMVP